MLSKLHSKELVAACAVLASSCLCAKNPMAFPEYRQTITAVYETEEDAMKAAGKLLPLPDGKKIAYTSRWDDTNPNNLNMSRTLHAHGLKGTFMLNGSKEKDLGRELVAQDNAIGNHTYHHYLMSLITPNQVFYEIAVYQAQLESDIQTPVVSFVFPFGPADGLIKGQVENYASVIENSGLYVFPFYWKNSNEYLKRPKDHFLTTNLFASNDYEPTVELYQNKFAEVLPKVSDEVPRVTHGIHVWMKDSGFKQLDQGFSEIAKNPDLVFMTENEYGAYRYSFLHGDLRKVATDGKEVTFEITRFTPASLGALTSLHASFEPKPMRLEVNGVEAKLNEGGFWVLAHDADKVMPSAYEWLQDDNSTSEKFQGVSFELIPDQQMENLKLVLKNQGTASLKNIRLQITLPPKWKNSRRIYDVVELKAGEVIEKTEALGEFNSDPDYSEGTYYFIARADFDGGRIYRTVKRLGNSAGPGVQAALRVLDAIPKTVLTPERLKEWSNPGKLANVTLDGKTYAWQKYASNDYNRHAFNVMTFECYQNKELIRPMAVDFIMPEDGTVDLRMWCNLEIYFNGERIGNTSRMFKLEARKGRNRIFFPHASSYQGLCIGEPAVFAAPEGTDN